MLDRILYWLGRPIVELYARIMLKMDVLHHTSLPIGPKIIVANHPSTTDPFLVLMLVRERVSILIHDTLFRVPVFGHYLKRTGHVRVVPGNGRAALDEAQQLIRAGRTVAIFPEGDISPPEGGFHSPRTGAARLALSTGAPVIPVGIHLRRERIRLIETQVDGKAEVGTWYLRGPYAITVGKPMYFHGDVEDRTHVRSTSEMIMRSIIGLSLQSAYRV
jgi:1-acyl-sn-glycerol-3-phosphate acyltransferase